MNSRTFQKEALQTQRAATTEPLKQETKTLLPLKAATSRRKPAASTLREATSRRKSSPEELARRSRPAKPANQPAKRPKKPPANVQN